MTRVNVLSSALCGRQDAHRLRSLMASFQTLVMLLTRSRPDSSGIRGYGELLYSQNVTMDYGV